MVPFRSCVQVNPVRIAVGSPKSREKCLGNRFRKLLCVSAVATLLTACNHVPYLCDDISQNAFRRGSTCLANDGQRARATTAVTVSSTTATGLDETVNDSGGAGGANPTNTDPGNGGSSETSTDGGSKSNKGHGNDNEQNGAGKDGFDEDNPGKGGKRG